MTLSKKYSTSIIASLVVAVLAIGLSFQASTAEKEEFDYKNSAINGMQIQATFHFEGIGEATYETFSVYQQESGFKKGEAARFSLAGLAGLDKIGIYQLADLSAFQRYSEGHPTNNYDIDIKITQNDQVLHEFFYYKCKMTDYKVNTLFDADETYSGKTKFALVDVFQFTCRGYEPVTPLFETLKEYVLRSNTTSTMDLIPGVTWESHPRFQSSGMTIPP